MHISQLIAAQAIAGVFAGRNLSLSLPQALAKYPKATPQQKAVAQDLSYGSLRFYGECDATLSLLATKGISDEGIRCLLIVALYQLLHDAADEFTVVNQAVTAAELSKQNWAKGLVNGVLRNFLRQKDELKQKLNTFKMPNLDIAKYSYPAWWIAKLKTQYPESWQAILTIGNAHPPMTLRVNVRKTSVENYLKILAENNIEATHLGGAAIQLTKPLPVDKVPYFHDGFVSVQDFGAQLAAHLLPVRKGDRVLDACAAPGGKTGHLLEIADIHLTALDSDATRLQRVTSNLERLQLNANLKVGDAQNPKSWWDGRPFDAILVDVPCSASGIVRRHVDMKWLRREDDIVSFAQQQAAILQQLWQCLAKGGKMLYVTCSIFYDENQAQITAFLKNNPDATELPILLTNGFENIQINHGQLMPNVSHDGLFYALLQKT